MELLERKKEQITRDFVVSLPRTTNGVPKSIISDRDGRYISRFWMNVLYCHGVEIEVQYGFSPQINSQLERTTPVCPNFRGRKFFKGGRL